MKKIQVETAFEFGLQFDLDLGKRKGEEEEVKMVEKWSTMKVKRMRKVSNLSSSPFG